MSRLLRYRFTDDELPSAWESALSTVGAIAAFVLALAVVHATEPWGAWLLNHASIGAHL